MLCHKAKALMSMKTGQGDLLSKAHCRFRSKHCSHACTLNPTRYLLGTSYHFARQVGRVWTIPKVHWNFKKAFGQYPKTRGGVSCNHYERWNYQVCGRFLRNSRYAEIPVSCCEITETRETFGGDMLMGLPHLSRFGIMKRAAFLRTSRWSTQPSWSFLVLTYQSVYIQNVCFFQKR